MRHSVGKGEMGTGAVILGRGTWGSMGGSAEAGLLRSSYVIPRGLEFSLVFEDHGTDV